MASRNGQSITVLRILGAIVIGAVIAALALGDLRGLIRALTSRPSPQEADDELS